MAGKTKAVVKKEEAALPIPMEDLEALSGQGFEEASRDAFAVPFLRILQSNSPQVEEDGPAYIDGAKVGMFLNTVTNQLFGKDVHIIPIHYSRDFVEWQPNRGGFVKSHGPDPKILERIVEIDDKNNSILDNGNVLQDTRNHYVLLADHLHLGPIILSLVSTGIRHSKKWMSLMGCLMIPNSNKPAPMFAGIWGVSTVRNSNDDGSWYQIGDKSTTAVAFDSWVSKEQLDAATSARALVTSDEVEADYASTVDDKESTDSAEPPLPRDDQGDDDDVPF